MVDLKASLSQYSIDSTSPEAYANFTFAGREVQIAKRGDMYVLRRLQQTASTDGGSGFKQDTCTAEISLDANNEYALALIQYFNQVQQPGDLPNEVIELERLASNLLNHTPILRDIDATNRCIS